MPQFIRRIDGEQIVDKGRLVHPELAKLAKKLEKD